MGKRLKAKIEEVNANILRLYNNLGNIAFWDAASKANAAPSELDWGNPKHNVTLNLTLSNAVVTHNGVAKSSGDTIQVEEGAKLTLIVAPAPNYALSGAPTASVGGTAITPSDNGNGTYTIELTMAQSDATLAISASGASAYGITYNLTGCAAPAGVTNPTVIMQGGSATIHLESTNGFDMPASLPNGAVTGATAAYTRDSQDATLATIVLSNATGNVVVAVSASMPELVLGKFVDILANTRCFIHTNNTRACLLVARTDVSNPSTWLAGAGATGEDTDAEAAYSSIPIPAGATKVSMDCNSSYTYGLTLADNGTTPQNTVEWTTGGTKKELLLADYPNAAYIIVNLKKNNNSQFSNETYASMGIDLQIS